MCRDGGSLHPQEIAPPELRLSHAVKAPVTSGVSYREEGALLALRVHYETLSWLWGNFGREEGASVLPTGGLTLWVLGAHSG
jgi:hypothetical protein